MDEAQALTSGDEPFDDIVEEDPVMAKVRRLRTLRLTAQPRKKAAKPSPKARREAAEVVEDEAEVLSDHHLPAKAKKKRATGKTDGSAFKSKEFIDSDDNRASA